MTNNTEENIELTDYFIILKRNWFLTLIIFLIIMGAAIAYTFTTPKIYSARSLVMVTSQDQTSFVLGNSIASVPKVDIETEKGIIMSTSVLNPIYSEFPEGNFVIIVESLKNSNIIAISVESENPVTSAKVANQIAESYVIYTRESKKQAATEVNNFISAQIAIYKSELDELNMELMKYKNKANLSSTQAFEYQKLQQEIAAKDKLYNSLLLRAEEISIVARENSGNVKIIEYAYATYYPVKPNVTLYIALGFILAIIGSLGIVFIKDSMRKTFRGVNEIEDAFGNLIMGVVPKIRKKEYSLSDDSKSGFADNISDFADNPVKYVRKGLKRTTAKTDKAKKYYLVDRDSEGPFAESIRVLRTNLMFYLKEKNIKLISINSAQKGDGKTTVAQNLSKELAHEGKKVLLVDANLRNPVLNQVFKTEGSDEGLSDVILGNAKLEKVICRTAHKNLYLLAGGKHNHVPGELLSPERLKDIFARLKASEFDIVLFDNTTLKYSESLSVAANSQGVLFIVALDRTNKEMAIKSKETLAKVKAHTIGVVVNFFK
ncbi:polysaccharide biosynthesis tyrosine autokinase [Candidatus Woesearchaeota archaeon]|nr:polysaccharide biosynthesis tyrosine autokinase [Candidatus Woesearchaeota archaeon]